MKRKATLVLLSILCCALVLPVVTVHADVGSNVYHFTVNPAYVPIDIIITFVYTSNVSLVVSSTNQSGNSLLTNNNPPSASVTFHTDYVDVFNFGFTAYYQYVVNQTVSIRVLQGSAMRVEGGGEVFVFGDSFSMTFTVATSKEPSFPTPEQLWDYGNAKIDQGLNGLQKTLSDQNNIQSTALLNQYFILGFIAVVFFVGELMRVWKRKPRGEP